MQKKKKKLPTYTTIETDIEEELLEEVYGKFGPFQIFGETDVSSRIEIRRWCANGRSLHTSITLKHIRVNFT